MGSFGVELHSERGVVPRSEVDWRRRHEGRVVLDDDEVGSLPGEIWWSFATCKG